MLFYDKLHDIVLVYNSIIRLLPSTNWIRIMPNIQFKKIVYFIIAHQPITRYKGCSCFSIFLKFFSYHLYFDNKTRIIKKLFFLQNLKNNIDDLLISCFHISLLIVVVSSSARFLDATKQNLGEYRLL